MAKYSRLRGKYFSRINTNKGRIIRGLLSVDDCGIVFDTCLGTALATTAPITEEGFKQEVLKRLREEQGFGFVWLLFAAKLIILFIELWLSFSDQDP